MLRDLLRRLRQNCADTLSAFARRRDGAECFILLVLVSLAVFLFRCLISGTDAFLGIFHLHGSDLLMDFFNSVSDAAQGAEAYTVRHVMYPPMANLLLLLVSRLIPEAYLDSTGAARHEWGAFPGAVLACVVVFACVLFFLVLTLQREPYAPKKRNLLAFAVVFSFPFVFLFERGNMVFLCVVFMLLFAQNYDSERRAEREAGLLALAFATSLKLYPVLFGVVLFADKRYREAARFALYVLLMFLLPSFFFGGPVSIFRSLCGVFSYSGATSLPFLEFLAGRGIPEKTGHILLAVFYIFCFVFFVLSSLLPRKRFVTWTFAAALCMTVPSIFSSYNWVLFLPALLTFFRSEKLRGVNWLYFLLMTIPFCLYIPKAWQDNLIIGVIAALCVLCAADSTVFAARFFRERKNNRKEVA